MASVPSPQHDKESIGASPQFRYEAPHSPSPPPSSPHASHPHQSNRWTMTDAWMFILQRCGKPFGSVLRAGDTSIWYSEGEIVNLATGAAVADMQGLELTYVAEVSGSQPNWIDRVFKRSTNRSSRSSSSLNHVTTSDTLPASTTTATTPLAKLYTRKIVLFKSAHDNSYLDTYKFRPHIKGHTVEPMKMPYQILTFMHSNESQQFYLDVEMSESDAIRVVRHRIPNLLFGVGDSCKKGITTFSRFFSGMHSHESGDPSNSKPKAKARPSRIISSRSSWESYTWMDISKESVNALWTRVGACPSWYGPGKCIYTLRSQCVRRMDDIPRDMEARLDEIGESEYLVPVSSKGMVESMQVGKIRLDPVFGGDGWRSGKERGDGKEERRAWFKFG